MVRMQVLLDEKHKRLAKRYAKQLKKSESEVIRMALENYDPSKATNDEELNILSEALKEGTKRAQAAIENARKEVDETLALFKRRK